MKTAVSLPSSVAQCCLERLDLAAEQVVVVLDVLAWHRRFSSARTRAA
jgi:hypothetical protein